MIQQVSHSNDNKYTDEGKCGTHSKVFLSRPRHVAGELSHEGGTAGDVLVQVVVRPALSDLQKMNLGNV